MPLSLASPAKSALHAISGKRTITKSISDMLANTVSGLVMGVLLLAWKSDEHRHGTPR